MGLKIGKGPKVAELKLEMDTLGMDKELKRINCQLSIEKLAPMLRVAFAFCIEEPQCKPYEYVITWPPRGYDNDGAKWLDK